MNKEESSEANNLESLILDNIPDEFCIVRTSNNNIIYPTDTKILREYNKIIRNSSATNGVYYLADTNEWYEKYSCVRTYNNQVVLLEYFKNITKFKLVEGLLQIDSITGISNRSFTINAINEYIKYALEHNEEFSLVLADIDYFKKINDEYGHLFGDEVLKNIGDLINANLRRNDTRDTDIYGRFGGDELFGLLKNISLENTAKWKKRAEDSVKKLVHRSHDGNKELRNVSVSIGTYHVSKEELDKMRASKLDIDIIRKQLLDKCDKNLYEEKSKNHSELNKSQMVLNKIQ